MKVDLYTKCVLTVIAACLVILVFENPQPVRAQDPNAGLRVVISGFDPTNLPGGIPVNIKGNAAIPVTLAGGGADGKGAIPVHINDQQVPVAVVGGGREGRLPVAINLTQLAGTDLSAAGVPVVSASK